VGTDIYADAVGKHWADAFVQVPVTADGSYSSFMQELVAAHRIELIIPGIEQDVAFWSLHFRELRHLGVKIALNDPTLVMVAGDKWLMHQKQRELGLCAIPTRIAGGFEELAGELGAPFLLKPRRGYAGKGIVRVRDARDFEYFGIDLGTKLIAQAIIGTDHEEFTVSGFGDGSGGIGSLLALQRRLSGEGATAKAQVVDAAPFRQLISALADAFRPVGPTNFQFRTSDERLYLLEINPRISSATSLRCAFGYNEAQACVDYYLKGSLPAMPPFKTGCAVRYIEDIVLYDRDHF
jgi:carbamoyl-phosphate synthase large subunit